MSIKNNPQPQKAASWKQYSPNSTTRVLSQAYIQPLYSKYARLVVSTLIILKYRDV